MNRRILVLLGALSIVAVSCSLLLEAASTPCSADAECIAAHGQQAQCVLGFCASPQVAVEAGQDSATPPECVGDKEASTKSQDQLALCVGGKIVRISPDVCPFTPDDRKLYQVDNAIVVPFILPLSLETNAGVPLQAIRDIPSYWLVRAAAEQISKAIGGVLSGEPGLPVKRPIYPIFCRGETDAYVAQSAELLITRARLPFVITSVSSEQLDSIVWNQHVAALPASERPLILNAFLGDARTESIASDGLLWHLAGSTVDVAEAVGPMVARTRAFLGVADGGPPGRVALVYRDRSEEERTASRIKALWGLPSSDFVEVPVPVQQQGETDAAYSARIDLVVVPAVQGSNPAIVVAVEPDAQAVHRLETLLPTPKPTFLLVGESALDEGFINSVGSTLAGESAESRSLRFFGVYAESDADPLATTLRFDAYGRAEALRATELPDAGGFSRIFENFFDAYNFAYYAHLNARLRVGERATGARLRDALPGLLVENGQLRQHFPDAGTGKVVFSTALETIDNQSRDLYGLTADQVGRMVGSLGVYRFAANRTRQAAIAVSCVALNGEETGAGVCPRSACSKYDQLRLQRSPTVALTGEVTCSGGFGF